MLSPSATSAECHDAPVPLSTAGMVLTRICRSSASDHSSMYCRSSRIQSSKVKLAATADLPQAGEPGPDAETTHQGGLGEPMHIAERQRAGSHQRHLAPQDVHQLGELVDARSAGATGPRGVIRGSSRILNTGPLASFALLERGLQRFGVRPPWCGACTS